eukprot:9497195-Pyramimonas_sp.AAC.1
MISPSGCSRSSPGPVEGRGTCSLGCEADELPAPTACWSFTSKMAEGGRRVSWGNPASEGRSSGATPCDSGPDNSF